MSEISAFDAATGRPNVSALARILDTIVYPTAGAQPEQALIEGLAFAHRLRDPASRELLRDVTLEGIATDKEDAALTLKIIKSQELAHLEARGRVLGTRQFSLYPPDIICNTQGVVDGARLDHYDPAAKTVVIRVDHTGIPDFWLEVELPLDKLRAWLAENS